MAKFRIPRSRILAEFVLVGLMMSMAPAATARHDYLDIPVEAARQYAGKESLLPMPFYMKGQSHPKELESLGEMRTNKRTQAFARGDEHACSFRCAAGNMVANVALTGRAVKLVD